MSSSLLFISCINVFSPPFSFTSEISNGVIMQFNNSPQRYGVVSAALHWLIAIAVYGMFALGLWMVTLSYYDGWYHQAGSIFLRPLLMRALRPTSPVACICGLRGA